MLKHIENLDKEFPDESLIVCPDITKKDVPNGNMEDLPYKQKVHCFKNNYKLWIFDFAELLIKGSNDFAKVTSKTDHNVAEVTINSGFAVLATLNPYFEIIGKLYGESPYYPYSDVNRENKITPKTFIKCGIPIILSDLQKLKLQQRNEIINRLYGPIRNSVAHSGLTGKSVILSLNYEEAVVYGIYKEKPAVVINSHRWYEVLKGHFDKYINILEKTEPLRPEDVDLQTKFNDRFHTLR